MLVKGFLVTCNCWFHGMEIDLFGPEPEVIKLGSCSTQLRLKFTMLFITYSYLMCMSLFVCFLMTNPNGAIGWCVFCDWDISWLYSLPFSILYIEDLT